MSLSELAKEYGAVRDNLDSAKQMVEELEIRKNQLTDLIIMEMVASGQKSARFDGIGLLTVSTKLVGTIKNKVSFLAYLKRSGQESLIKEDVHYQTLQAWMNDLPKEELEDAHACGLDYQDKAILSLRRK